VNFIDPAFSQQLFFGSEVDADSLLHASDDSVYTEDVIHPIVLEIEHNKVVAELNTMQLTTEMQLGLDDLFNGC
jgi:hypothetical protein